MRNLRESLVIALLFTVTAELLRANGPLLDNVAGSLGIMPAAFVALCLFLLPGVVLVTMRRASLPGMIVFLLLVRMTAQLAPNLPIIGAGAVLGLVCVAVAAQRAADPASAVTGLLIGGMLDLTLRAATNTWDLIWVGPWGLFVLVLTLIALVLAVPGGRPNGEPLGRAWAVGAYFALWTTTIGNPAFFSRVPLQLAICAAMLGILVSIEATRRLESLPYLGVVGLVGTVAGTIAAWWGSGWGVVAGVVVAQAFSALSLVRAFASDGQRGNSMLGLVWVLPVLLYQLHYESPLPFDNRFLIVGTAVLIGLSGLGRRAHFAVAPYSMEKLEAPPGTLPLRRFVPRPVWVVTFGLALLLLVPLGFAVITPGAAAVANSPALRIMTWNVKYGRDDASGHVNPAQIAATIRAQNPDIVVLQEVSRGWAIGGGMDLAHWLARDLGMEFYWAPAADDQFGNLLLVPKARKLDVSWYRLPFGQGPMWRSYLSFEVDGIDIVATHLTHRKKNTPTRIEQIQTILEDKPDLVLGDLNFWPTWDERRLFESAGYFSAQDVTGSGAYFTSPTDRATNRVDWAWGSRRVEFIGFRVVGEAKASDHFPLVIVLRTR